MCGIVGAVAQRNVVPILIQGLLRLEYRGYDSAGLVVVNDNKLERVRSTGRVAELTEKSVNTQGHIGIAHTRWATHGIPSERNGGWLMAAENRPGAIAVSTPTKPGQGTL